MPSKDIVVYKAIFDDYDILTDPEVTSNNIKYVCFTDDEKLESVVWDIRVLKDATTSPNIHNRRLKMKPHELFPEFEYSVYLDGNIHIVGNIETLIKRTMTDGPLAAPSHPSRESVAEEARKCIDAGLAPKNRVNEQLKRYRQLGFPDEEGLTENSVLIREHNDSDVVSVMEDWWQELGTETERDQLSLQYTLWKNDVECTRLPVDARWSSHFRRYPHTPDDWRKLFWRSWIDIYLHRGRGSYRNMFNSILYYTVICSNIVLQDGPLELLRRTENFIRERV
ncbi:DUF616 domain-containing protein [Halosimplex litoreum]|uniref:DUF616 domain-containing protein n=1 Tax=Halosimplex litoreum TaxID=1198301 RepID=A0A7T3FYX2_9EURY|nr:glycosyltransferase domain-containing protein [Halosimplex litoreum]QPV63206.1 DUF616 domain-containing protein [Halosimplex litoreum]